MTSEKKAERQALDAWLEAELNTHRTRYAFTLTDADFAALVDRLAVEGAGGTIALTQQAQDVLRGKLANFDWFKITGHPLVLLVETWLLMAGALRALWPNTEQSERDQAARHLMYCYAVAARALMDRQSPIEAVVDVVWFLRSGPSALAEMIRRVEAGPIDYSVAVAMMALLSRYLLIVPSVEAEHDLGIFSESIQRAAYRNVRRFAPSVEAPATQEDGGEALRADLASQAALEAEQEAAGRTEGGILADALEGLYQVMPRQVADRAVREWTPGEDAPERKRLRAELDDVSEPMRDHGEHVPTIDVEHVPDEALPDIELTALVRRIVDRLAPQDRATLAALEAADLRPGPAAKLVGIDPKTLYSRLKKIRKDSTPR
jgi:hypothetical protein